ncbi:hypothetical protein A2U01_0081628, partial [Trifolium medium]|nr:hypothetical protein [Trifolium medium]
MELKRGEEESRPSMAPVMNMLRKKGGKIESGLKLNESIDMETNPSTMSKSTSGE